VQALASLLLVEDNRKLFMSEEWSVTGLVLLLDTRFPGVAKQFPIAALHILASNAKCRKQIMAAGACYHLRVLADMEITGAKRLLDRLVTGKLRTLITRTCKYIFYPSLISFFVLFFSLISCSAAPQYY